MNKEYLKLSVSVMTLMAVGYAAYATFRPAKPLSQSAAELANAFTTGDAGFIGKQLFDSEYEQYKWDDKKKEAIKSIFDRVLRKIELIKIHSPEDQAAAGQGFVLLRYRCKRTGKVYDGEVVSYITPDGVKTPLCTALNFVWVAEYRNDVGDAKPGQQILLESIVRGLDLDQSSLEKAGFYVLSNDGIHFPSFDMIRQNLDKFRRSFLKAQDSERT